jgi:hypothetical protein
LFFIEIFALRLQKKCSVGTQMGMTPGRGEIDKADERERKREMEDAGYKRECNLVHWWLQ